MSELASLTIRERMASLAALAQREGVHADEDMLWRSAVELAVEEILERLDRLEAE